MTTGTARRRTRPPGEATVREHLRLLDQRFGPLDPPKRRPPLEELILTVLSQNTSDVNRDRAFTALRRRFPTWEALAGADPEEVADAIRPGGLAATKAPRILAILREIRERRGRLDLRFLSRLPDEEVAAWLTSLPGVGPKTAACVLAFSLGRPALPVDTHVFRTAGRLGYLSSRATPAQAHAELAAIVPEDIRVRMHVGLIRLGREVCKPGRPLCEVCPLKDLCPTAPLVLGLARKRVSRRGGGPRRRGVPR